MAHAKDIPRLFIREDVQSIMKKMTGLDLGVIFAKRTNPTNKKPSPQLLTQQEMDEEVEKTYANAKKYLQMPPFFLKPREDTTFVIDDSLVNKIGLLNTTKSNYYFFDVSKHVPHKKKTLVVREPNGLLRTAHIHERERVMDIYYPTTGRYIKPAAMFRPENLENCCKIKAYNLVLNRACLQYEPNHSEFIRITQRIYNYVDEARDYAALYSTRFYGPMAFYLAYFDKIENFLIHLLLSSKMEDAVLLTKLYELVNEKDTPQTSYKDQRSHRDIMKAFILKKEAKIGRKLEDVRHAFKEWNRKQALLEEQEEAKKVQHQGN